MAVKLVYNLKNPLGSLIFKKCNDFQECVAISTHNRILLQTSINVPTTRLDTFTADTFLVNESCLTVYVRISDNANTKVHHCS